MALLKTSILRQNSLKINRTLFTIQKKSDRLCCDPCSSTNIIGGQRTASTIAKLKDISRPESGKEEEEEDDFLTSLTKRRGGRMKRGVRRTSPMAWLTSEEGMKFRDPIIGQTNWLGGDIPFPTNPWFKPSPPLSDSIRTKIYESFKNRVEGTFQQFSKLSPPERKRAEQVMLRQTSDQWGISKERVTAVIRLKAMEEYWCLTSESQEEATTQTSDEKPKKFNRTLQLNFEKGMENVLGVERESILIEEDPTDHQNRRLLRKSNFYGTEFVPLDSPKLELTSVSADQTNDLGASLKPSNYYQEDDEPTDERQIIGHDGIPRPSKCHITKAKGKIPMVFTDVSKFPRAPKPMSKKKAKYFLKTPLFANFSPSNTENESMIQSSQKNSRRSNSTWAPSQLEVSQISENGPCPPGGSDEAQRQKESAAQLLQKVKGTGRTKNGIKLLDAFRDSYSREDEIVESVLMQIGGLSFRKSSKGLDSIISPSNVQRTKESSNSIEEKQIREMKYEMMKSIYSKKLELSSAGRLLLPKSVREKEERDQLIMSVSDRSRGLSEESERRLVSEAGGRSNQIVKRCMKGPMSRIKQREQARRERVS
ncbi:hypothetical protein BY996DRAFT_2737756 [Phakopsora pachyrhizi]|nr:hypothetical protein BY996DRAFT_2737756 [Phakopsora pachyrhizi]